MKPVEEFIYRMKFNAKTMTVDVEQVGELIRCKECMYKPTQREEDDETIIDFPVPFKCPCECEDPWYDWVPEDDWFCGNAKRRKEE